MKLKNLFAITLSVFLSTQVVLADYIKNEDNIMQRLLNVYESENNELDIYGDFAIYPKEKAIKKHLNPSIENVVIPSVISDINIEILGYGSFPTHNRLKSITISEGIKVIEYSPGFVYSENLETVTIPSSVEIMSAEFNQNTTIYLPYHNPGDIYTYYTYNQGIYKAEEDETFGAKRVIYGTGENQIIVENKELTQSNNTNIKNDSAKSVKLKVGEKVATVNGVSVALDTPAYINSSNNSVYVPLRFVSVALVGEDNMMWDASTKTVAIFKDSKSIKFTVGNNNVVIDGKAVNMGNGIVPEIKDGRVFVPFRPLGEALGMNVKWDSNTKTAIYE